MYPPCIRIVARSLSVSEERGAMEKRCSPCVVSVSDFFAFFLRVVGVFAHVRLALDRNEAGLSLFQCGVGWI